MPKSNASDKPRNPHAGHRGRMRQRFLQSGIKAFEPNEVLETLLFYTLTQKNTNGIAHELLHKFGDLTGVLNASVEELCTVKNISENSAVCAYSCVHLV